MGYGDEIMATGIAKRLYLKTGKKVAFGKGKIIKNAITQEIFLNNPKIASTVDLPHVVWEPFFVGSRSYMKQVKGNRIYWNYDFKAEPGEFFFENETYLLPPKPFILLEPHTKQTVSADNKQWPLEYFQEVINKLKNDIEIIQPDYGKPILSGVTPFRTTRFRHLVYLLNSAKTFISLEGGVHHAAAAVGLPGVVIWGGYVPPSITGYLLHKNIVEATEFCGSLTSCSHCKKALEKISPEEVIQGVREWI